MDPHYEQLIDSISPRMKHTAQIINRLNVETSDWHNNNPPTFEAVIDEDRLGWEIRITGVADSPELDSWGLLFGDAVHNLRSVMNTFLFKLAEHEEILLQKPGVLQYPIAVTVEQWNGRKGRPGQKAWVAELPEKAQRAIYATQPFVLTEKHGYPPEMDVLAVLGWLSNGEKHKVEISTDLTPDDFDHTFVATLEDHAGSADQPFVYDFSLAVGSALIRQDTRPHRISNLRGEVDLHMGVTAVDSAGNVFAIVEFLHKAMQLVFNHLYTLTEACAGDIEVEKLPGAGAWKSGAAFTRPVIPGRIQAGRDFGVMFCRECGERMRLFPRQGRYYWDCPGCHVSHAA